MADSSRKIKTIHLIGSRLVAIYLLFALCFFSVPAYSAEQPMSKKEKIEFFLDASIYKPHGLFGRLVQSGTLFTLSVQYNMETFLALEFSGGYTWLNGSENEQLKLTVLPFDITTKIFHVYENGWTPFFELGMEYAFEFASMGTGKEQGSSAGLCAGFGLELQSDAGFGIGLGLRERVLLEPPQYFWALSVGIKVSWKI